MPYIEQSDRARAVYKPENVGELTYAVQQLLRAYIVRTGRPSYSIYAECLGALRGAELDMWDRMIQPHEVAKREQNGDVW